MIFTDRRWPGGRPLAAESPAAENVRQAPYAGACGGAHGIPGRSAGRWQSGRPVWAASSSALHPPLPALDSPSGVPK